MRDRRYPARRMKMEHPQHCQQLAEQIATETDEAKRERMCGL